MNLKDIISNSILIQDEFTIKEFPNTCKYEIEIYISGGNIELNNDFLKTMSQDLDFQIYQTEFGGYLIKKEYTLLTQLIEKINMPIEKTNQYLMIYMQCSISLVLFYLFNIPIDKDICETQLGVTQQIIKILNSF